MINIDDMVGWVGESEKGPVKGIVQLVSPLGEGNMTGTGEYKVSDLIEITVREFVDVSMPQVAWILDDEDVQDEYELQKSIVLERYGVE